MFLGFQHSSATIRSNFWPGCQNALNSAEKNVFHNGRSGGHQGHNEALGCYLTQQENVTAGSLKASAFMLLQDLAGSHYVETLRELINVGLLQRSIWIKEFSAEPAAGTSRAPQSLVHVWSTLWRYHRDMLYCLSSECDYTKHWS